jgi:hypothetical protein
MKKVMTTEEKILGRAKLIIDVCDLLQDHTRKRIITNPLQATTILDMVIYDTNKIIEEIQEEYGTTKDK